MRFPYVTLMILAVVGLLLSLMAHVCTLFGWPQLLGEATMFLHVVAVVLAFPVAYIANFPLMDGFKQKDFWKAVLRGCPKWMRRISTALMVYAMVSFLVMAINAPPGPLPENWSLSPMAIRGVSGMWMCFFTTEFTVLYSGYFVAKNEPPWPWNDRNLDAGSSAQKAK